LATLTYFMNKAGFCNVERVGAFNVGFSDSSMASHAGYPVSLNVVAKVCDEHKHRLHGAVLDDFEIEHNADPYDLGFP
jgi:hypothetical protein